MAEISLDNKKNEELEKEKASLLTVIRLLQDENNANLNKTSLSNNNDMHGQPCGASNIPRNKRATDSKTEEGKKTIHLSDKKKKKLKTKQNIQNNPLLGEKEKLNTTDTSKQGTNPMTTLILGDSIVSRLNSFQISKSSKSKVIVRAFAGAHVRDIYHYMLPALEEIAKPVNVVLHVGTNYLHEKAPQVVADEIIDFARHIEQRHPDTTVCLSDMTLRQDSEVLSKKVSETNKITNRYCTQSGRLFIKHNNS